MSFKLPTQEDKHDYVHDQFERIAKGYDLSNDVISVGMHRAWKLRAITELMALSLKKDAPHERGASEAQEAKERYLDVCCGTGDLALAMAKQAAAGTHITGLDFSQNMLDLACERQKRLARRKDKIKTVQMEWICGDAQNLPFEDNTFNGAIISFGLRNLTDLQKGLDEMTRVVKPGGRVVNLDLGHSTVPLFAPIFDAYFSNVVPVIGGILQDDRQAYKYLPESGRTYPRPEAISEMFNRAGLINVRHIPQALGTVALHVGIKR
ncbi:ubiquinone/menaquinone biosynthesis methyltransferase [bacterium]|nr:ubiquinone/menaquinone biosynthesis methyltransferase [bacterium]MBP9807368.1 ubiquinone/menaquinone biosynthesis methyltransferase [bacterium]